jgi:hypothetical protein
MLVEDGSECFTACYCLQAAILLICKNCRTPCSLRVYLDRVDIHWSDDEWLVIVECRHHSCRMIFWHMRFCRIVIGIQAYGGAKGSSRDCTHAWYGES